ncbi:MAG TPA: Rrf2 family transcriptional regulator [Bellilinea sp.]|nr:Rrf2 family transcriptional regulator [Bellilinea sp.]
MFKISKRLDYGFLILMALASTEKDEPIPSHQLSKQLDIPLPFLHQIAHSLMQNGLIKATPGPRGGIRLNIPADEITALKIVEILEGPINICYCKENESECNFTGHCAAMNMWAQVQTKVVSVLVTTTLAELAKKSVKKPQFKDAIRALTGED